MIQKCVFLIASLLLMAGCNYTDKPQPSDQAVVSTDNSDQTIYALTCDGCNDTILVYLRLPYNGGDPDTLNILEASKSHHVIGLPHIGDKLAIVRDLQDTTIANMVIVTEQLRGRWCYQVYPTLRKRADMEGKPHELQTAYLPDSLKEMLQTPREYGFSIKNDQMLHTIGRQPRAATTDEESPIEYPHLEIYNEWKIFNGRFVMLMNRTDSLGESKITASDTADFIALTPDSLILRFGDEIRGYYRQTEEGQE